MISILCPTRERPAWLKRMVKSVQATATNAEVVCYVDDDDTASMVACAELELKHVVGPRITLTDCWNKCLPLAAGDILMQGNDDIIFRTNGWDQMVVTEFDRWEDKIVFVHGSDEGLHFNKFGAHGLVHKRWVEIVGYFIPPYFSSDFGDAWLNEIANLLKRRIYLPFIVEHMHFMFKKAPMDKTYDERLARHQKDNVDQTWDDTASKRLQDFKALRLAAGLKDFEIKRDKVEHPNGRCSFCDSACVVRFANMIRCNQCGRQVKV